MLDGWLSVGEAFPVILLGVWFPPSAAGVILFASSGFSVGTATAVLSGTFASKTGVDGMEQIGNGAPHVGWNGGPLHICMSIHGGEPAMKYNKYNR